MFIAEKNIHKTHSLTKGTIPTIQPPKGNCSRILHQERHSKFNRLTAILLFGMLFLSNMAFNMVSPLVQEAGEHQIKCYTSVQIEEGDNLWNLCDAYYSQGYSNKQEYIMEVKRLNHLSDTQYITAGAYLVLPYYTNGVTVQIP